jgi:hypothetical protein
MSRNIWGPMALLTPLVSGRPSAATTRRAGSNSRNFGSPAFALDSGGGCPPDSSRSRVGGPTSVLTRDSGWQATRDRKLCAALNVRFTYIHKGVHPLTSTTSGCRLIARHRPWLVVPHSRECRSAVTRPSRRASRHCA